MGLKTLARYFLISDYLVFPQYEHDGQRYDEQTVPQLPDVETRENYIEEKEYLDISILRNRTLISISKHIELKIVYFNYGTGNIMVKATGLREAYRLARAFQTYLTILCEITPNGDRLEDYLIEVSQIPQYWWNDEQLAMHLVSEGVLGDSTLVSTLQSGQYLFAHYLHDATKYVQVIYQDLHILEASAHLDQSYALFFGLMSGSYYHYHYSRDRVLLSRDELLKDYLENKAKYELAFLAAFKAIERLFGNSNINKAKVRSVFQSQPYSLIKHDSDWESFHEIFSQKPQHRTFEEMLKHFLEMRNIVAAHGNQRPPQNFLITQDNLFEIQRFASHLIYQAIESCLLSKV